jgi:hypothetical protein
MRYEVLTRYMVFSVFLGGLGTAVYYGDKNNAETGADIEAIGNQLLLITQKRDNPQDNIIALKKAQDACNIKNITQYKSNPQSIRTNTIVICEPGTIQQDKLK